MAEDGEPGAVSMGWKKVGYCLGHLPRVEPGELESVQRISGVTPNWCTPLWTALLNVNDYRVI
jgi:hypothetical protein